MSLKWNRLNKQMKYPTIVVDNFFDNPNEIVEYSKTLKYYKADPTIRHSKWQGKRTESIHNVNRQLYDFVISKALSYFFPIDTKKILYENTKVCFHKQGKEKGNLLNTHLHKDNDAEIAGVIYLNKGTDIKRGTTILNDDKKKKIIMASDYNTMIAYDSKNLHGASLLDKARLTIVFFIDKITILNNE
jgi:hypothetical protein